MPDFGQEKARALTAGDGGGPINSQAHLNIHLLDDVCFIPFRRQEHEVKGLLDEIERQRDCAPVLIPHSDKPYIKPQPEPEPQPRQRQRVCITS